jgi:hypothetical protein
MDAVSRLKHKKEDCVWVLPLRWNIRRVPTTSTYQSIFELGGGGVREDLPVGQKLTFPLFAIRDDGL